MFCVQTIISVLAEVLLQNVNLHENNFAHCMFKRSHFNLQLFSDLKIECQTHFSSATKYTNLMTGTLKAGM